MRCLLTPYYPDKMRNLLCELIRAALCGTTVEPASDEEWWQCYEMARRQQVLAMTFPVMSTMPKEQRPSFRVWNRWMVYTHDTIQQSIEKKMTIKTINKWLAEEGLSTMIIKGFSVASLYPNIMLRESCDIDIYSGSMSDAVNACFVKHGVPMDNPDGHHWHFYFDNITVEHHFSFGNGRIKRDLLIPESLLRQLAVTDQRRTSLPAVFFPNLLFSAIYVGSHAFEHFMNEKIELRHIVDWMLVLKQLSADDAKRLSEAKKGTHWGHFFDTMTAIGLHRFGLPAEWFPAEEVEMAEGIDPELEQRVWNDTTDLLRMKRSENSTVRRLTVAGRMLENRWKFNAFSDIGVGRYLWNEFRGWIKAKD